MAINYLFIVSFSFLSGIVFETVLKKLSSRYNILTPKGIPLIGGISIGLSFSIAYLVGFYLFNNLSQQAFGLLACALIILIFGIIDDRRELSIWAKFLVQIAATGLLITFGIRTQIVYIGNLLNIVITFIWVLGITNALNHLDIIDGLAGASALIVSLSFLAISFLNHDANTLIFSLALIGAVSSFLIHNLPPARIYMGNSGSHFLGFILAAIALIISYAPLERKIALFSPLFILGLPIFDTFFLILTRIGNGRLPYKKSNDHLSLRLIKLGYSKPKALLFMLLLGIFFAVCGVMLSRVSNYLGIGIIGIAILLSLFLVYRISRVPIDG